MKNCNIQLIFLCIVIVVFSLSIIYLYNIRLEGMKVRYDCPNSLKSTSEGLFKLSYTDDKKPPDYYYGLDEYVKLINWQKDNHINCPILSLDTNKSDLTPHLLHSNEEQKIQLLLDANRDDNIYNVNQYPGFDSHNLYIGTKTPLDLLHNMEENKEVSANAMNTNWGGSSYSREVVDSGFYKENT